MSTRAHRNPAWNNVNINMMSDDELSAAVDTLRVQRAVSRNRYAKALDEANQQKRLLDEASAALRAHETNLRRRPRKKEEE